MYWFIGILLIPALIASCIQYCKKRRILRKIKQMDEREKLSLLDGLLHPFGFCYQKQYDMIASTLTAWQRQFGYCSLYDRTAFSFGMILDCEPIFFYWKERTWRIELWKGQYGINLGAEIGIYYADGQIEAEKLAQTKFQCAQDEDLLGLEMALFCGEKKLFENSGKHWWLTGFLVGKYGKPKELTMKAAISFADCRMLAAFVEGLKRLGYRKCDFSTHGLKVCISFESPHESRLGRPGFLRRLQTGMMQQRNRFFCRIYLWVTRPFACTLDRLLYLSFFLPGTFRRLLRCRKNRGQKCRRPYKGARGHGDKTWNLQTYRDKDKAVH